MNPADSVISDQPSSDRRRARDLLRQADTCLRTATPFSDPDGTLDEILAARLLIDTALMLTQIDD